MRSTSLQLLTALYPSQPDQSLSQPLLVPASQVRPLFPKLSDSGFRSLLFHLGQKGYLMVERTSDTSLVRCTFQGIELVRSQIPVFQPHWRQWQGEWAVMVFLTAPDNDRQFRYLRQALLDYHAVPLTRGVYLYPSAFPSSVVELCSSSYPHSVAILKSQQWIFGDVRSVIMQKYRLADLAATYSGVSRELNQLIAKMKADNESKDQYKKQLSLLFYRWWDVVSEDVGLTTIYFPTNPQPLPLLQQWQHYFFASSLAG